MHLNSWHLSLSYLCALLSTLNHIIFQRPTFMSWPRKTFNIKLYFDMDPTQVFFWGLPKQVCIRPIWSQGRKWHFGKSRPYSQQVNSLHLTVMLIWYVNSQDVFEWDSYLNWWTLNKQIALNNVGRPHSISYRPNKRERQPPWGRGDSPANRLQTLSATLALWSLQPADPHRRWGLGDLNNHAIPTIVLNLFLYMHISF